MMMTTNTGGQKYMEEFARAELLWGQEALEKLRRAHVAVFGVGGVGAACCEALCRGGVGRFTLFDPDAVSLSNINRQFVALHSTLGQNKAEVMRQRMLDIYPEVQVQVCPVFYSAENAGQYPLDGYDFVVDCIDTVASKLLLIETAHRQQVPIISALGAGNKEDPTLFRVADIYDTKVCPLARALRSKLKKMGINRHLCVYSQEEPLTLREQLAENGRHLPGSLSFVPPVMGMILAGEVLKRLAGRG